MKKFIFLVCVLLVSASAAGCSDAELDKLKAENSELTMKVTQQKSAAKKASETKNEQTEEAVNTHEYVESNSVIKYKDKEREAEGYLIDDQSYVFRLDDIANQFGLDVFIDENGAIAINGEVEFEKDEEITSLAEDKAEKSDRYTVAGLMDLVDKGDIEIINPTSTPKPANSAATSSSNRTTSSSSSKNSSGTKPESTPKPTERPIDKDRPFDFENPPTGSEMPKADVEKSDTNILEDFALYREVASKFYSRFSEVPNLTWAESSVDVVQISNHKNNASYWYYVPDDVKGSLEQSYVTVLTQFGYEYAGSSGNRHTYALGSNAVSFGYDGSDFLVSMTGLAECEVGEEYANGYKSANIPDFGQKFGISCNEEVMYYGDWVYAYPASAVDNNSVIPRYINALENKGFEYSGTQDGRSTYTNGNIVVGTRIVDDSFYVSIVQK